MTTTISSYFFRHTTERVFAVTSIQAKSLSTGEVHLQLPGKRRNSGRLLITSVPKSLKFLIHQRASSHTAAVEDRCAGEKRGLAASPSGKEHQNEALPFTAIPGPKPLPIIGNKLLFTRLGGYPFETFWSSCEKLYHKYGPIVRVSKLTSKMNLVFVFRPEDTQRLFQNEGSSPIRPPLDILEHYRKSRPDLFTTIGLVPGNGPEWRRLRTGAQLLLKRNIVNQYRQKHAKVADDFVTLFERMSPCCATEDLLPILFRYTLEAVGVTALGTRLGCLENKMILSKETYIDGTGINTRLEYVKSDISKAHAIITANEDTLQVMGESLLNPPFHKIFQTRSFRRLSHAQEVIANLVEHQLNLLQESWKADPEEFSRQQPFIAALLNHENLNVSDVFLLLTEVFQGGIDATATSIAFCLHYLSNNEEVQSTLYEEVKDVDVAKHDLQGLRFLRAVLQETFRLRPSASANSRILHQATIFSGYHVPAGTLVSSPPVIACHDEEVFPNSHEFQPERWLSNRKSKSSSSSSDIVETSSNQPSETAKKIHPYTVIPFGHGARMCPGRRLAEQEILILIIQMVKTFKLEQYDRDCKEEIGQVMRLNMMPDAPIRLRFTKRSWK